MQTTIKPIDELIKNYNEEDDNNDGYFEKILPEKDRNLEEGFGFETDEDLEDDKGKRKSNPDFSEFDDDLDSEENPEDFGFSIEEEDEE